jgi:phospholipase C
MRRWLLFVAVTCAGIAASLAAALLPAGTHAARPKPASGIHKIKHVIVIMQENRSFDHYFGTYPGADGFRRDALSVRRART